MRLHEVYLLEYNRNVTQDKWGKRILAAAEVNYKTLDDFWLERRFEDIAAPGVDPFSKPDWVDSEYRIDPDGYEDDVWKDVFVDDVLEAVEEMDPTPNKQYVPILLKWYCGSIAKNQQLHK